MNRAVSLSLVVFSALAPYLPAADPTFRYHKAIERGEAKGEGILAVALDREVYAATREGFPDVRILDDAGAEVPYVLEVWNRRITERHREPCASRLVSLRETPERGLEIVVELDEKAPFADGITVVSPLSDYEHRVRVEGAAAGGEWEPLVASGAIFDYSRYMDIRNRDVGLRTNRARRFRLVVSSGTEQLESPLLGIVKDARPGEPARQVEFRQLLRRPFRIDRIELWRTVERESVLKPEKTGYGATILRVEHDRDEKLTHIDVQSGREPLVGLTIRTQSRNFHRPARIQVPDRDAIGKRWRDLGRGTVHRYQLGDFRDEMLTVEFPEHRSERYRIVVEDADSPPLEIVAIEAVGVTYRLTFVAAEGRDYRLVYGSEDAPPPRYDAAAVLASLGPAHQAVAVGLGPEVVDVPGPAGRSLKDILNSRAVLMLALGLMILVLAWVLLRAGKQIAKMPDPEI